MGQGFLLVSVFFVVGSGVAWGDQGVLRAFDRGLRGTVEQAWASVPPPSSGRSDQEREAQYAELARLTGLLGQLGVSLVLSQTGLDTVGAGQLAAAAGAVSGGVQNRGPDAATPSAPTDTTPVATRDEATPPDRGESERFARDGRSSEAEAQMPPPAVVSGHGGLLELDEEPTESAVLRAAHERAWRAPRPHTGTFDGSDASGGDAAETPTPVAPTRNGGGKFASETGNGVTAELKALARALNEGAGNGTVTEAVTVADLRALSPETIALLKQAIAAKTKSGVDIAATAGGTVADGIVADGNVAGAAGGAFTETPTIPVPPMALLFPDAAGKKKSKGDVAAVKPPPMPAAGAVTVSGGGTTVVLLPERQRKLAAISSSTEAAPPRGALSRVLAALRKSVGLPPRKAGPSAGASSIRAGFLGDLLPNDDEEADALGWLLFALVGVVATIGGSAYLLKDFRLLPGVVTPEENR